MSEQLGTIDELPTEYLDALTGQDAMPLWPSLRGILPYDKPTHRTVPHVWRYEALRPLLLRAGELTPMEKAERRVLMLANPGLDGEPFATASIFFGFQLILPGETAPNHRHSPSAVRLIIEGEGGFTTVEGTRFPYKKGDTIVCPAWAYHEHAATGDEDTIMYVTQDMTEMAAKRTLFFEEPEGVENLRHMVQGTSKSWSATRDPDKE